METTCRHLPSYMAVFLVGVVACLCQSYVGHVPRFETVISPVGNVPIDELTINPL